MSLSVSAISKRYGSIVALRGARVTVAPDEVRALFGGNGSGKSTLAKVLGGVVRPDVGDYLVDGVAVQTGSPSAAHSAKVAITFQELSLLGDLTVAENLALTLTPRLARLFRDDARIRSNACAALANLGLTHLEGVPVHALKVGEKYLVELAKALQLKPRYLVLDELTAALHSNEAAIVKRVLDEHRLAGGGAIVVSHRINEIRDFCDTITVLRNGEVVAERRVDEVSAETLVGFLGGSVTVDPPKSRDKEPRPLAFLPSRIALSDVVLEPGRTPISLDVRQGEIVGLGGLPDQGQADVLSCFLGMRDVRAPATLMLDGRSVQLRSPVEAIHAGIVYVSGDRDEVGFPIRSIQENLIALMIDRRDSIRRGVAELESLLASLSTVYGGLSLPLNSLSGGNQQKVLLARCLLTRPKVLLAADPTKGIDVTARAEVHASIRHLARDQRASVIITSSDDRELAALCDRVIVMEKGMAIAELRREVRLDEQAIVESYMRPHTSLANTLGRS